MNIIRVQIGQEKVKDFVKEESEKLRQAAEEAKDEVDQLSRLTRDRSNLAFDSATADINKLADDFEEQLKASREKLEADDQEFMDWEQKTAIKRSEGTFFQNLYRIKKELPGAQAAAAVNTEMQAQEAEQRAEAVEAAVQQTPPQSAIKLYVTSALTAVLSFAVVSDALSKSPSWGQDVIASIGMVDIGGVPPKTILASGNLNAQTVQVCCWLCPNRRALARSDTRSIARQISLVSWVPKLSHFKDEEGLIQTCGLQWPVTPSNA
ncbi:hypothetical protein WJX79_002119 [Trebouxia sp. C0005]